MSCPVQRVARAARRMKVSRESLFTSTAYYYIGIVQGHFWTQWTLEQTSKRFICRELEPKSWVSQMRSFWLMFQLNVQFRNSTFVLLCIALIRFIIWKTVHFYIQLAGQRVNR